jgi:TPR repeat protein
MILWEIVTGKKPYADFKGDMVLIQQHILSGKHEEIPSTAPSVYRRLIESCWSVDPKNRPTVKTIIQELTDYKPVPTITAEEYYQRGIQFEREQKLPQVREQYEASAKLGLARAMTNIGFFLLNGLGGFKQNIVKAYENFLVAAQKGHARAMVNLATMLEKGEGTTRDQKEALKWYELAVKAGDLKSQAKCEELRKALQEEAAVTIQSYSSSGITSASAITIAAAAVQTVRNLRQPT